MNEQTIVAVYDTATHADAAVRDLEAANVPADAISRYAKDGSATGAERSVMVEPERRKGFWSRLFGGEPEYDTRVYDRSIDGGATVVAVKMPAQYSENISNILEKRNPVDIDEGTARHGPTRSRDTAGATGRETMPLSEETLSVGKRRASGGTTRIRRYVVETPVEKPVNLHSEKVIVERHPVSGDQPARNADFTDNDKTIEMTETNEEPVVSKTARVKEEVSLHKEASDRAATVKDTVRREDAKIEQVPDGQAKTASGRAARGSEPPTPPGRSRE